MSNRLTQAQRDAAKMLLNERPEVIPFTRVIRNTTERVEWFDKVTIKMHELNLTKDQISEFCDIAGVPD